MFHAGLDHIILTKPCHEPNILLRDQPPQTENFYSVLFRRMKSAEGDRGKPSQVGRQISRWIPDLHPRKTGLTDPVFPG